MTKSPSESLTPAEAGRALGVSYPTIKQWIYKNKIRSVRTPGGHHRIPRSEIVRLRPSGPPRPGAPPATPLDAISGRNKLAGIVTRIRVSGLLAEVALDVGGQTLTSIITAAAARELRLKPGAPAVALIKATEVMVSRA